MSELMMWRLIPADSQLEVRVTPADGEFAVTGKVRHVGSRKVDVDWADEELRPGPKSLTIQAGRDYVVDLLVSFASAAASEATVNARVVKSNGNTFSQPDSRAIRGKNGDAPSTVTIVLTSKRAG